MTEQEKINQRIPRHISELRYHGHPYVRPIAILIKNGFEKETDCDLFFGEMVPKTDRLWDDRYWMKDGEMTLIEVAVKMGLFSSKSDARRQGFVAEFTDGYGYVLPKKKCHASTITWLRPIKEND